jgi:hypothetical protein
MKRSESSLSHERGTLPLASSDPSEAGAGDGTRVVLGRYRLEQRLGAGGFGVVWRAWDENLEREVAVKAISRERGAGERVEREALAAARLNHPGIVAFYELAGDEGHIYLVSELVRGRTLAELEREGALSDRDVARIGRALCDALAHAHARGVIHRDVKPQNVIVLAEPAAGAGFAKLTDFGVAHVVSAESLTRTGDLVGTLAYMSPEQAEGVRVTSASDAYSLALTLYEAWTGSNPIRAATPAATARRLGRPLPSLATLRPDLPAGLCAEVDAALDPDPMHRPDPAALAAGLEAAEAQLADTGGLVEPATLRRVGLPSTRRRGLLRRRGADPGAPPAAPKGVGRTTAGLAGGALVLVVLEWLGPEPPFSPLVAAGLAALAIALLPRLGWLLSAAALCVWLASPEADRQGTALVVAAAAMAVPLLLPRAGMYWSLPALAPLLGTVALAPAFVGVAALARTPLRRAGLAASGALWLVLGEALTGEALLFDVPDGGLPLGQWEGSFVAGWTNGLEPLFATATLALAAVWAVAAVLLPVAVRGRWLALDLIGAGLWAAGLIIAQLTLGDALSAEVGLAQARGAVAGPIVAALVAVCVSRLAAPAEGVSAARVTTA